MRARAWLRKSLAALGADIERRGGRLHLLAGEAETLLPMAGRRVANAVHVSRAARTGGGRARCPAGGRRSRAMASRCDVLTGRRCWAIPMRCWASPAPLQGIHPVPEGGDAGLAPARTPPPSALPACRCPKHYGPSRRRSRRRGRRGTAGSGTWSLARWLRANACRNLDRLDDYPGGPRPASGRRYLAVVAAPAFRRDRPGRVLAAAPRARREPA